jgi:hypothetical protein
MEIQSSLLNIISAVRNLQKYGKANKNESGDYCEDSLRRTLKNAVEVLGYENTVNENILH